MAKHREGREYEYYKGTIRNLRAEVKRLKRRIRELEKQQFYNEEESEELIEDILTEHLVEERKPDCKKCGLGYMQPFEISGRVFSICNRCRDRIRHG